MIYGQFFLGCVALIVATIVYRWQKHIDLRNNLRSERRELYRKYVAAVESFKSGAASGDENSARDAVSAIKIAEAEILVSIPPNKLPQRLILSDLAVIVLIKELKAKLPGGDEQDARDARKKFLDAYDIVMQAMRFESLSGLNMPSFLKEDHEKHTEWLNLYQLEQYERDNNHSSSRKG